MERLRLILLMLVFIQSSEVSCTYVATFSNVLFPGIPLNVNVQILSASTAVTVKAELVAKRAVQTTISHNQTVVQTGIPTPLILNVPDELNNQSQYFVRVSGSGGAVFVDQSEIHLEEQRLFILIQTDKTRYSAGQEVKFRVIHLLPNLFNYRGKSAISIFDGNGNKINVLGPQPVHDGVIVDSLTLSEQPVFGTWKIAVSANGIEAIKTFEVFDYVLPKFTVSIEIPSVTRSEGSVTVKVTARFTFNSDVFGTCKLQVYNADATDHYVQYEKQISGSTSFTIPMDDLRNKLHMYGKINVRAIVIDNATALTMVAEKELKFVSEKVQQHLDIKVLEDHDSYFVPGVHYYAPVFIGKGDEAFGTKGVIQVNGTVTTAEPKLCHLNNPPNTWIDVQTTHLKELTISYDESGYAALRIPKMTGITEKIAVELSYGQTRRYLHLKTLSRTSLKILRIAANKPHGKVGDKIFLDTESTIPLDGSVLYQTFARGILIQSDLVVVHQAVTHHYQLSTTEAMTPKISVTATFVTKTGTILSDHVTILIAGSPCKNKVNIALNATDLKPGESINLHVSADPHSVVYMLAEDERNRLLGSYNDVFFDEVKDITVHVSDIISGYHFQTTKKMDFMRITDAHMSLENLHRQALLSDTANQYHSCYKTAGNTSGTTHGTWTGAFRPFTGATQGFGAGATPTPEPTKEIINSVSGTNYSKKIRFTGNTNCSQVLSIRARRDSETRYTCIAGQALPLGEIVRSRFPETWIWESYTVDASGIINISKQVPDSITSWVISTMATNPTTGFGITETKPKITVKKDFFVTMDLPSSIIQGEEFLLQIGVFSYSPLTQRVYLQIESSENRDVTQSSISVKPNQGQSTYVHFTPSSLGTVSIKVTARMGSTDSLVKNITVLPRGVLKTDNEQHLVDVRSNSSAFTTTIVFANPKNMVDGTRSSKMTITGDFMVPSIDGLQNLIKMPYGCGEQTMLNFAPDIFIAKYLKSAGKLTSSVRSKLQSVLKSGYQREMQFRHSDGSFSAFGDEDSSGSSWLTAFVLKCFHQAGEFLKIDQNDIVKGMTWLLKYQKSDGSFYEPGRIIHTAMQAGTSSGIKLTAFILISLLENRHVPVVTHNLDQKITKGTQYLESKLSESHDVYTLSLLCYALSKAGSSSGSTCFTKLKNVAILDDDKMYWKASSHVSKRQSTLSTRAPSADIEATSYSLLTFMSLGKTSEAFPIVKWLVAQRNPSGGFQSTQDTVISLQALAEFSSSHSSRPPGYAVQFNAFGMGFSKTYSTTLANFDVVQTVEFPDYLSNVVIQAMGIGSAVFDVAMSYYVSGSTTDDHIGVTVNIVKETINSITVHPCISWKGSSQSGMIVMEVEMPTGYQPDNDQLNTMTSVKKHETNGRHVNLYFDSMQRSSMCVDVKLDRRDPVVKNQASHVTVYDYYEPIHQATTRYESGILKNSNICDVCPLCNFCAGFGQIEVGK